MGLKMLFVHERFDAIANLHPEKIALVYKDQNFTFSEMQKQINLYASQMQEAGVQLGDLVIVHGERIPNYLMTILAVLKSGGAFLPLDSKLPEIRKKWIQTESKARFIVDYNETHSLAICMQENGQISSVPKGAMYVMYTSGSSGKPKGVIGTHIGLLNRVDWMQETYPINLDEIHVHKTPLSFVDHIAESFQALLHGVTLIVLPDEIVSNVQLLLENLSHYRVTRVVLVPSLLQIILRIPQKNMPDLGHLRFIFSSGEVLPTTLAKQCCNRLPKVRLVNIYGSTEVSADATYYEVDFSMEKRIEHLFKRKSNNNFFSQPNKSLETLSLNFSKNRLSKSEICLEEYLEDFKEKILPYSVDVSDPKFVGHMTSGLPNFMGELSKFVVMLNQNTVKIETSKATILLERQVIATLHKLFYNFSASFYEQFSQSATACLGLILSGGTIANIQAMHMSKFQALLKAQGSLERAKRWGFHKEVEYLGYNGVAILGSKFMHYSMKKAVSLLGLGEDSLIKIQCDKKNKIDLKDLQKKIDDCKKKKILILSIIGVAGTTELGSIDPLLEMGTIAEIEDLFFHVDASWGGPLIFSKQHKHLLTGIEKSHSITICGHKQLYTPLGTSILLLKDQNAALPATIYANYQATLGSHDLGQFSLLGSKPAHAIFLDAALQIFGERGYEYMIEKGCRMSQYFAHIVASNPCFELISFPEINIFTYRYIPASLRKKKTLTKDDQQAISKATHSIQQAQFLKGETCVSFTTIQRGNESIGVFRTVFANPLTTYKDLIAVLQDQLVIAMEHLKEPKQKLIVPSSPETNTASIPIGVPLKGAEVFLLDDTGKEALDGEIGQIHVGGTVLSAGYLNDEKLTAESFISYAGSTDKKVYRTGDFGKKISSGHIEFVGRRDQQVKIRGCRINLIEVEQQILDIDSINQACALVFDDELIAFYSRKDDSLRPQQINDFLRKKIPEYMIPSKCLFLEKLPLLPNGKIDRQALYHLCKMNKAKVNLPPTTKKLSLLETITSLCKSLLNLDFIDNNTNFFDMGFTSLSINMLLIKLQELEQKQLKLTDLYTYSSITLLSKFLESDAKVDHLISNRVSNRNLILEQRKSKKVITN